MQNSSPGDYFVGSQPVSLAAENLTLVQQKRWVWVGWGGASFCPSLISSSTELRMMRNTYVSWFLLLTPCDSLLSDYVTDL